MMSPNKASAQDLTFDETIEYLNTKIINEFIVYERVKAFTDGRFTAELSSNPSFTGITTYNCDLKGVTIDGVVESGPREIGPYKVYMDCINPDCVTIVFSNNGGIKRIEGHTFYFNSKENAMKFQKALKYLKSIMLKQKDPFD